ncbi:hypothetical protein EMIHUDRAFT_252802 [Emiliania huxleyi CCMP1516]|uniref:Uncharacterized protein n=2 Tax=Emiliania huxleyi TaxID=2903 RepID=A0A0D3KG19_EMIH1|nr:hypothetical protein EMIHUDRAFT_252802 [Emiliania huxleyi CCMP1516]EOD34704.1 hypothetical protein EMIHUDRAFT_252802 [Emiliania huxleyi CCMP1516]|eukprot:XP_005787133.1 hypothetical protein EMIHUDRAFT_252802 [Emiliania huxleyi CCMP1516]
MATIGPGTPPAPPISCAAGGLVKIVKEAHAALGLTPEGGLIQQTDFLLLKLFG